METTIIWKCHTCGRWYGKYPTFHEHRGVPTNIKEWFAYQIHVKMEDEK